MKKTVLYDEHLLHGGKMIEFGGFLMPIEYRGIALEHQAVREKCGLFDVSHMGEIVLKGPDANRFLNYLLTNEVDPAVSGKMVYGLLLYPDGGVVDDLMVYAYSADYYLLVVNASNKDKDYQWLCSHRGDYDVEIIDESDNFSQLALQGPLAAAILQELTAYDLRQLKLFDFAHFPIQDMEFLVSRSGYTGEDGFEIYGANADILALFRKLVSFPELSLCGLGCRDTLRFEAAMPLYGHEISEQINPLVAGLGFAVRLDKDFIGREVLEKAQAEGLKEKIVGIELLEKGIARSGYEVEAAGKIIGQVTTGYLIPNSTRSYAFALIAAEYAKIGTEVFVHIRKNKVPARVRNKKFLDKKYIR
jgi:aminomethyltransferase